jgi:hypothetical protein
MTLDQLAGLLGITMQVISKYGHGKTVSSPDVFDKLLHSDARLIIQEKAGRDILHA